MQALKILIPTDFSVQSDYAYLMVKKLEERIPADIHFLHVLAVPDTVTLSPSGEIQTCGEIDVRYVEDQKSIAERKLAELRQHYGEAIHTHLVLGKITDAIIGFAATGQFDLIVMGTKGSFGLKEKFSGSEARIVARKSPTPVLSLMCDRSDLKPDNILLVHNFDHPSAEDLTLLKTISLAFGSRIHLLQIITGKGEHNEEQVRKNMEAFARLNGLESYDAHVLKDSDVEQGVVHFNQQINMDIVCIGTHGKGNIFHQSAAEKLIQHLFKPIISFHLNQ